MKAVFRMVVFVAVYCGRMLVLNLRKMITDCSGSLTSTYWCYTCQWSVSITRTYGQYLYIVGRNTEM